MRHFGYFIFTTLLTANLTFGQQQVPWEKVRKNDPRKHSGFRVGCTYVHPLDSKMGKELGDVMERESVGSLVSQFGWQYEREYGMEEGKNGAVSELLVLAGGLDQGVCIPSVSWLIGFRLANGFEFGGGPNVSLSMNTRGEYKASPAFVWGTGYTVKTGKINFPLNVALLQTRESVRTTFLTGFVMD